MEHYIIQIVMGLIGSVGFAVLFGIYDRKLIWIAFGGGAGWAVYLLCTAGGQSKFAGLLVSALCIAAFSEILSRVIKAPVIMLLVPMLIPEIPGGDLYYTMYYLVQGDYTEFGSYANQVLGEAGAIALGIILASYAAKLTFSVQAHAKQYVKLREKKNEEKCYKK